MSFSSDIKEELNKISNLGNKEQVKYELIGYLMSNNISDVNKSTIKFTTENEYNINRFSRLLSNLEINNYRVKMQGKNYIIEVSNKFLKDLKIEEFEIKNLDIELQKALIRGNFLGAGSMNNPENNYHLEIELSKEEYRNMSLKILDNVNIEAKKLSQNSLYIKDGEEISKFLAFIGASKSVLKFEQIRVNHEMSNKINRIVNCESANLNKTMNASIEQIEAINKLKKNNKFELLNESLKEIANLRLKYPNSNLNELGQMLKNPVGKSGVNYRLKKIIEISKQI